MLFVGKKHYTCRPFNPSKPLCKYLHMQDYSNALRVTVRGQATLKLITDKPTLKMDSQSTMVRNEEDEDDKKADNND